MTNSFKRAATTNSEITTRTSCEFERNTTTNQSRTQQSKWICENGTNIRKSGILNPSLLECSCKFRVDTQHKVRHHSHQLRNLDEHFQNYKDDNAHTLSKRLCGMFQLRIVGSFHLKRMRHQHGQSLLYTRESARIVSHCFRLE